MSSLTTRDHFNSTLPLIPVEHSHHTCKLCGGGCRSYDVLLTEREARRLDLDLWRPLLHEVPDDAPLVLLDTATGQHTLNKVDGRCVFLDSDNLCIVHKSAGLRAKPLACQFFPFQTVQTPEGTHVSLNVGCRRLIEMTPADAPLDMQEAGMLLGEVTALATIPAALPLTPDEDILFDDLKPLVADLLAILSEGTVALRFSRAAQFLLQIPVNAPPAAHPLFADLHKLVTNAPPLRPSLTALYAKAATPLTALLQHDRLIIYPPQANSYFAEVARQHLAGYQFALHRTARTGLVALLAAFVYATFAAQMLVRSGMRADHALNEAVSDGVDLFLSPAGQVALTEPNQQAFLLSLLGEGSHQRVPASNNLL